MRLPFRQVNPGEGDAAGIGRAVPARVADPLVASGMLPVRRDPDGPFAWRDQMRPRFFAGFHGCLPALAAAGSDLIVEHIIESVLGGRTGLGWSKASMYSSSACTATWRKSAAASATGEIAVSERAGRGEACPLSDASQASGR